MGYRTFQGNWSSLYGSMQYGLHYRSLQIPVGPQSAAPDNVASEMSPPIWMPNRPATAPPQGMIGGEFGSFTGSCDPVTCQTYQTTEDYSNLGEDFHEGYSLNEDNFNKFLAEIPEGKFQDFLL